MTMINLKTKVKDHENGPIIVDQNLHVTAFDEAVEVTFKQGGEERTRAMQAGFEKIKTLTFRALFMRGLREEKNKDLSIDRKSDLIGKMFADHAVFDEEDRADLIKSVKSLNDPLLVYRTKEFFRNNPIQNGQQLSDKLPEENLTE